MQEFSSPNTDFVTYILWLVAWLSGNTFIPVNVVTL